MPSWELVRRGVRKSQSGKALGLVNQLGVLTQAYGDTDKHEHGYMPYYQRHLGRLRLRKQVVFEIGVGGYDSSSPGGSLRIWRDYFVRSTIVGLDIEQKTVTWGPRVKFERVDQSDAGDLARVVERYGAPTVVIDDGSHVGRHIWASFEYLWPLLPSGGVYVVEDLSTAYYPSHDGGDPTPADSSVALLQELADAVQVQDPVFRIHPDWGQRSPARFADVAALAVYPGIAFIEKA